MSNREETEPIEFLNPPKIDKAEYEERFSKLHGTSLGIHDDGYERVEITVPEESGDDD